MKKLLGSLLSLTLVACGGGDDSPAAVTPSAETAPLADTGTTTETAAPEDTGSATDTITMETTPPSCTSARDTAIKPIDKVSTGEVKTLATAGDVKTLYVDASAGGTAMAASNPWVYVDLATAKRVDIDDKAAFTAKSWDLALKRPILRSNSGDSGAGEGGAVFLKGKSFDTVTDADAKAAKPVGEDWFDDTCTLKTDPTGAVKTSFDGWYDYDGLTMKVTPAAGTWIVRGAAGKLFRLEIQSYYSTAEGADGMAGGKYRVRVAEVK